MQVTFERHEELAPGIWRHYFRPERAVRFEPGQYLELQLSAVVNDPRGARRTLTLTSLPGEPLISFVTKDQPVASPYKQVLANLQPGDGAIITDPMGDLVLPKSTDTPLIFIAGGIGISSFVSMLQTLQNSGEQCSVQLHYGLRSAEELIFSDILDSFAFEKKNIAIAPERLTAEHIVAQAAENSLWYISGSQRFVETMRTDLVANNVDRQTIVFDYYDGYAEL